jgi:hypothetical protein
MLHTINARLPCIVVLSAGLARRREGSAREAITRIATFRNRRPLAHARKRKTLDRARD